VVTRDECPPRVLQDGFVIVPAQTKFHDLISVVLQSLQAEIGQIEANERVDGTELRTSDRTAMKTMTFLSRRSSNQELESIAH
jgi:hypothetical protein